MDTEIMVIAIVSIVMGAGIATRWLKTREVEAKNHIGKDFSEKLDKIERLEKRVAVLEKIVTNKKVKLAEEIDSL